MQDTQDDDPYNGKVLLAAVICLSAVVIFVILLHAYGRWLLRRSRTTGLSEIHLPRPWSPAEADEVVFSGRVNGLDAKVVAGLPEFVYRATEQQGRTVDCVVCLSSMDDGERGRILPRCGHGFHSGCIDAWLTAQSTCPICRAAVAAEEVVVVVEADVFAGGFGVTREVSAELAVELSVSGEQGSSSSSSSSNSAAAAVVTVQQSSSCACSLAGCSLKGILSKSRSAKRLFPSALDRVHVAEA